MAPPTLDEAIQVLKTNGIAAVVIHHLGETYNPSSFRQKFPNYGITAPSSSRAEYVQDDIADIAIHETPRRALKFHPDLDALIALSSEDHIEAACHITELEVGDFDVSPDHDISLKEMTAIKDMLAQLCPQPPTALYPKEKWLLRLQPYIRHEQI